MTATYKGILMLTLVAAFASLWLYLATLRDNPATQASGQRPALYIDAPDWQLFDARGEPAQKLRATRLEQWTQQEPAMLLEPRMELRDPHRRRWLLSAKLGSLFPDQGPIHLENDVVLRGTDASAHIIVATSRLQVARRGDRVETNKPVVLRTGNWHFNATGLRADLGQQRLELLEQVKGRYE